MFFMSQFIPQSPNLRIYSFSPKLKTHLGKCKHFSAKERIFLAFPSLSYNANAQTNEKMETPPVTVQNRNKSEGWLAHR